MKAVLTLLVLANEGEARLLENDGVGKGLRQVRHLTRSDLSGDDIAYSDTPGRGQSAPGAAHHGMEPSTSEIRQNRERFAADLWREVARVGDKGGHDRLIVSAPPKMLGALRDKMPAALSGKLVGELSKDLLHEPLAELAGHFTDMAAF